jgi:N-acetylglucosamine-6-phosphate deacetylase
VKEGSVLLFDEKVRGMVSEAQLSKYDVTEVIDAAGNYVAPGLIDVHIHGYLGEDASDGSEEGLLKMAEGIVKNGVTAWLPTTMTVSVAELRAAFALIRKLMNKENNPNGAQILGVNAEGPFINPAKKGAQAEEHILPADAAFIKEYEDVIRLITIAPEVNNNLDVIREIAADTKILISVGHTAATCAQTKAAFDAGAGHVTHLFNAMTAMGHRDPGAVGAALSSDRVSTELIADTFHISPDLFGLIAKIKEDKLVLITDCVRAGGMADGEYDLGGQPIFLKGIECRLADGTIAGSVLRLNEAVRNFMEHTDLPVWKIVRMASLTPAERIGMAASKGSLLSGRDADIIIADAHFGICRTIIGGETVYEA